jgi:hypothetical protein
MGRSISSVGTGSHDSVASVGSEKDIKAVENAFAEFGMKI